MEDKKNLKDKIDEMSVRTFTVSGMSERDFQRFIKFCELNAKATKIYYVQSKRHIKKELIYSIAIKQLLDAYEADAKVNMLYDKILALEENINNIRDLKLKETVKKEEPKKERIQIKTMGRRDD